jgi:hypothetical protein
MTRTEKSEAKAGNWSRGFKPFAEQVRQWEVSMQRHDELSAMVQAIEAFRKTCGNWWGHKDRKSYTVTIMFALYAGGYMLPVYLQSLRSQTAFDR